MLKWWNIGRPVLELSNLTDGLFEFELSSIKLLAMLAPNVAAFINFSSDHVQRHGGLGGYFYGKAKSIFWRIQPIYQS